MHPGLGSSGSARRYSRNHCCFLFLRLLRCFSSPGSPRMPIRGLPRLHHAVAGCFPAGFPHSDTHGSMDICSSPWLFAACRVFLRPLVPRHPPCALPCLTSLSRLAWRYSVFPGLGFFYGCVSCFWFSIRFSRYNGSGCLSGHYLQNESYVYLNGLKWTRTTDLTLIRRAL